MNLLIESLQATFYLALIVIISKYMLVETLRNLAQGLNLKSKTVGNIAGVATSMPELFTVCLASISGLNGASIFNILSSNIINLNLYLITVAINKNIKLLNNRALKIDLSIALITILIPIYLLNKEQQIGVGFVAFLFFLFIYFYRINIYAHRLYLNAYEKKDEEYEDMERNKKVKLIIKNIISLIIIAILLYFIGEKLSVNLSNLCNSFKIPQYIVGFVLGLGTSIPELITFFESQRKKKINENRHAGVIEATNNLLTSNMLNLFVIQAIGMLINMGR